MHGMITDVYKMECCFESHDCIYLFTYLFVVFFLNKVLSSLQWHMSALLTFLIFITLVLNF